MCWWGGSPRDSRRAADVCSRDSAGLGALRDLRLFALVLVWTLGQWVLTAASFYVAFKAVGIEAPFSAAVFTQSLLALSVAVPSTPGFFGLFEGVALAALSVYGVPDALALSYAIGYHITSFIPITVIGLVYFARLGLRFRDLGPPGNTPPRDIPPGSPPPANGDAAVPGPAVPESTTRAR